MPNQLAKNKKRKSLAEHEAVLAALSEIARVEGISVMSLMRRAIREIIRKYADDSSLEERLRLTVMSFAPKPRKRFATRAQLSRFKRQQREFDKLLLDLHLDDPEVIETQNSIVSPKSRIRVLELEKVDAKA